MFCYSKEGESGDLSDGKKNRPHYTVILGNVGLHVCELDRATEARFRIKPYNLLLMRPWKNSKTLFKHQPSFT